VGEGADLERAPVREAAAAALKVRRRRRRVEREGMGAGRLGFLDGGGAAAYI
jgi:hypothetical protein